jgi:hypothetical protein
MAVRLPLIELAGATNFLIGITNHFTPLSNPANGTRKRENSCK